METLVESCLAGEIPFGSAQLVVYRQAGGIASAQKETVVGPHRGSYLFVIETIEPVETDVPFAASICQASAKGGVAQAMTQIVLAKGAVVSLGG